MHNARLGRFFSVDPLSAKYPHNSPYAFSENRVVDGTELEGSEFKLMDHNGNKTTSMEKAVNAEYVGYKANLTAIDRTFNNFTLKDVTYSSTPKIITCDCPYQSMGGWNPGVNMTYNKSASQTLLYENGTMLYSSIAHAPGLYSQPGGSGQASGFTAYVGELSGSAMKDWISSSQGASFTASVDKAAGQLASQQAFHNADMATGRVEMVGSPHELFLGPGIFKGSISAIRGLAFAAESRMATSLIFNSADDIGRNTFKYTTTQYSKFVGSGGRSFYGMRNFSKDATKMLSYGRGSTPPMPMWNSLGGGAGPSMRYIGGVAGALGASGLIGTYFLGEHMKALEKVPSESSESSEEKASQR
ncbi:hypothetical protein [Parvicella tangerina]|uniref:RHS repeat-associated core domain-containing protein n=1 Tax=Parvicella tangerina TaxID=2829795 RepID=A0A916NAQ8_9FLAO|nr:hypothetical protein [Parvicella tangerina]CAG5081207.1 hypothetical protein CRYO30217_01563 [Parvicella tangerina]